MGYPALSIRPVEVQNPLDLAAKAQAIKAGQQEIQMRQRQMQDNDALTKAFASIDFSKKDALDALPQAVVQNGGSGQAALSASHTVLQQRQISSDIAKNDALTNSSNAEAEQKVNDQYRGRILGVVGADPSLKQSLWDKEITSEEQGGKIQPGTLSHTYPGDAAATALANHFALGSVLVKEAQEKQKLATEAWKPSGGALVNTITGEKIGGLPDIAQMNTALESRYQVLHPGEQLPDQFKLKPGASPTDFDHIDKVLEATEKATATKAQQETTNAIRAQTYEMARDKSDLQAVVGTDPKTGKTTLASLSQSQTMGLQNPMKADADMVNKAEAARHWLVLANKQAPASSSPDEMGISQLIDKMDNEGKLGPLASRWNEFMAGKIGSGDPEYAALRAKMGLSTTLLMQAHVGSRGGAALLEHFDDLAQAKKMDGPTLKAAFNSEINYVQDKAMDPNPPSYKVAASSKAATPSGHVIAIGEKNYRYKGSGDTADLKNYEEVKKP